MSTIDHIDRVVERERAAAIDALADGPDWTITDANYPPGFVYDRDSWHSDCAQMITSMDADTNDRLRTQIGRALYWLDAMNKPNTTAQQLMRSGTLTEALIAIGGRVLQNAIDNGLTTEKLGE